MSKRIAAPLLMTILLILMTSPAAAEDTPTVAEQMTGLETMCQETADARSQRQEQKSLYERLGGYDKIHTLALNIIGRHRVNEPIKHLMNGVDDQMLAKHLTDFVSAGTGGTANYTGRSLRASHAKMNLTDADFLAAGGDIIAAMQEMKYGQNEIDEFVCILVSLKDQVVFK